MTAKQFLDSFSKPNAEGLYDGIGPQNLVKYARQACEEQRRLCAEAAKLDWDDLGEKVRIDKKSILNAPSPV